MVKPQLGVKTGANSAFLDPPDALRRWCRSAVRGRDVRAFRANASTWLLWPADARGHPWTTLPEALHQHLTQYAPLLRRRADLHGGPWWRLFRATAATAPYRVVWSDLAQCLRAAVIDDASTVPLNSCYVAAMPSAGVAESLAAWLNSTWIRALARLNAEPAAGGCARFAARTIGSVPLPQGVLGDPVLTGFAHAGRDRDVQAALDECVADVLGLDTGDRALLASLANRRR